MTHALPDPFSQAEFYSDVPAKRFFAWIVDSILILLLCLLIVVLTAFLSAFVFPLLWLVVSFLYRWITISSGSATWGMRLLAIEFRDSHGQRFDGWTAFLHTLIYSISFGTLLLHALSIGLILFSPRRQSLADHLLGTVAINRASAY